MWGMVVSAIIASKKGLTKGDKKGFLALIIIGTIILLILIWWGAKNNLLFH